MVIRIGEIANIAVPMQAERAQEPPVAAAVKDFGAFLQEALAKVEMAQHEASAAAQRLATGEVRDMAEVMIASEKATLSLQLTIQVRNKVLEAYQEIMRMPV